MATKTVSCAKLGKTLPGLDESTPAGSQALRMCLLFGGKELAERVKEHVSAEAWGMWADHMRMVINEFRLDPTSDESNAVLRQHMEAFFFGEQQNLPGYVPQE
ncbi:MAG: Fe(2+)-trafficking protein [Phycisphaerae bacterium]|jgi:Fe-S cluster biosynthesis and repair protein YggX